MDKENALLLKKLTLKSWANTMYSQGKISLEKHRLMIKEIEALKK